MKIAIVGAAGTGKTRLADDLSRHVPAALITDSPPLLRVIARGHTSDDPSLRAIAHEHQRIYDLTLLAGMDLPWVTGNLTWADLHQREQMDSLLRAAMQHAGIAYFVVYGSGAERLNNALRVIPQSNSQHIRKISTGRTTTWAWSCEKCSDPDCEHRLFTGLRDWKGVEHPPR